MSTPSHRVRTEAPFYPVEGDVASVARYHADLALKALDYWKRVSDVFRIKVPSGSKYVDFTLKREKDIAARITRVARAFVKSPEAGAQAWMKNATKVQEFFGGASRTMDDSGFQDLAVSTLHKAWTRVTDGSLGAVMKARKNPRRNPGLLDSAAYHAGLGYTVVAVDGRSRPVTEYAATKGRATAVAEKIKRERPGSKVYTHKGTVGWQRAVLSGARANPKKRNPSARSQFDAAYRAHRAWTTRRIPISEYSAATRGSMASVHAESAHKSRTWKLDVPTRLSWRQDSQGRLDAYLGNGSSVTVMPPPSWMYTNGPVATRLTGGPHFVAVIDRLGIGGAPRYLDASGRSDYGTVVGRTIVFPTVAKAKAAANRYLLRLRASLAGKAVGSQLREIDRRRKA